MLRLILLKISVLSLLTSCASDQPLNLNADNPASPAAREAVTSPAHPVLGLDQATKRTRELIAARAAHNMQVQPLQQDQQNMSRMKPTDENSQQERDHDHQ
jgi:hypothetical protein